MENHRKTIGKWRSSHIYIYIYIYIIWLVVFLEHDWMVFPFFVGNVIVKTDEAIFFRGVGIPPTSQS